MEAGAASGEPCPLAWTRDPQRIAVAMATGETALSYAELEDRSHHLARQLAALGCLPGDKIAVLMENCPEFLVAAWAAQRAGLHYVLINWHLTENEVIAIVEDCGASVLLFSPRREAVARAIIGALPGMAALVCKGSGDSGFVRPDGSIPDDATYSELEGSPIFYSGGTSGRPKGIFTPTERRAYGDLSPDSYQRPPGQNRLTPDSVFICTTPLYHAAGLVPCLSTQRIGGTVVLIDQFDAETTLAAIERFAVTHVWMVPTMFSRLLRLPPEVRDRYDLSSVQRVIHAAGPCSRAVKQAMFDWLGPRIYEYYSGTEGIGATFIGPEDWLAHPGSVGKSDDVRIVGPDGELLPPGEIGVIYFETSRTFEYVNAEGLAEKAFNSRGWGTLGDVGYVDEDGFLYLTDRLTNTIVSGGVNIYPQEIEDVLAAHPDVFDVAVIGVPNSEYGEEVKAVVVAEDGASSGPELERRLIAYCQEHLSRFKCPRSVDFVAELPRLPSGKLLKRELKKDYWPQPD